MKTNINSLVAARIKALRRLQNIPQRELAERIGMSMTYLSDLENDKARLSLEQTDKIAQALGTSIVDLVKDEQLAVAI